MTLHMLNAKYQMLIEALDGTPRDLERLTRRVDEAAALMRRRGILRVDRIVLAGAFGSYIDPLHAMVLGMFPDCDLGRVVAVGNAAGDGARIALLNRARRAESARAARNVHYIETAIDPHFQEEFVNAMHLPNRADPFPHLQAIGVLPAQACPPEEDARAKRRRERRERSADPSEVGSWQ